MQFYITSDEYLDCDRSLDNPIPIFGRTLPLLQRGVGGGEEEKRSLFPLTLSPEFISLSPSV